MKLSSSGESASFKKCPPSRLQKQAPASLRLEPATPGAQALAASPPAAWGGGSMPIPLLSPLVVTPESGSQEADLAASRRAPAPAGVQGGGGQAAGRSGGGEGGIRVARHGDGGAERQVNDGAKAPGAVGVWRHPAMPLPVAEPSSLVPFLQSQCALEVRNAQQ